MGLDLHPRQRAQHRDQGKITGGDGRAYSRRGTRTKRKVADALIESGVPLVLEMYGSGQFEWFDGDEARAKWTEVRPYVISTDPTPAQLKKHERWQAGLWDAEDGHTVLHLNGLC